MRYRVYLTGLAAAGCAAYLNSFSAPFLFDDFYHIVQNPRIRDLLQPAAVLGGTARPLVALTLAVNYALGGLEVWGYHLFNLIVHLLSGMTLFGIIHRTLVNQRLKAPWGEATGLAFAASLIWLIHPLQTESVTYVIQRGESLMGLFYLLTLYCVIRGWHRGAVLCCALGMLAKPVMVTAPLMVLFYDRIFLSSSWRELFRQRGKLHAGLAVTWLILPLALAGGTLEYQGLVGIDLKQVSPLDHLLTQPGVILHYLRLCFWPHPLILDYRWPLAKTLVEIAPAGAAILGLLGLTAWALRRRPEIGFLGLWFFVILAPTSSFLPTVDPAFEHRMYLPLAAVVLLFLIALKRLAGPRAVLFWTILCLLTPLLTTATVWRNRRYNNLVVLWNDIVLHRPSNARAHANLGAALHAEGRYEEAAASFWKSLALEPGQPEVHNNLGAISLQNNQVEEALLHYRKALRLFPNFARAHNGMARTLQKMKRLEEAAAEYEEALCLNPIFSDAHVNLGLIRQTQGRRGDAFKHYKEAIRLNPKAAAAYNNIGTLLFQRRQWREAVLFFHRALELDPDYAEARDNLRRTLVLSENNSGGP